MRWIGERCKPPASVRKHPTIAVTLQIVRSFIQKDRLMMWPSPVMRIPKELVEGLEDQTHKELQTIADWLTRRVARDVSNSGENRRTENVDVESTVHLFNLSCHHLDFLDQ